MMPIIKCFQIECCGMSFSFDCMDCGYLNVYFNMIIMVNIPMFRCLARGEIFIYYIKETEGIWSLLFPI